jgi:hypothetical protein
MEAEIDLKVEITKSGYPTLKIFHDNKELYLHSKYNPIREAETWAQEYYEKGKMVILIGLGLGYYGKALLKIISKEDRILIIEPYKKIFDKAEENGLRELLGDDRVFLCLESDKEKLGQILRILIQKHFLKNSKIFISPNYEKICSTEIIINSLKRAFADYAVDINTKLEQATSWQENYLRNIKYAIQSHPIAEFENKFNCPIVIVSAGPSVTKELTKLKEIYDRALIISSGTATTVLIKNNIKPHIIVSIDGHIANYNHFKEINYDGIPLLYSPNSHYKIVEEHIGPKIIFQWSGIEVIDWYDDLIGFKTGTVKAGPSVANFALDIAYKITSGPICFIGQDLGFVGGYSHAEGNINRTKMDDLKNSGLMPVESNDGSELYTDYAFTLMREWFENYLYINPRSNVFNATLAGAKIKGTEVMEFERFIAEYCDKHIDIKQLIDNVILDWDQKNNDRNVQTDEVFNKMLVCLNKVIELTKKARIVSKKLLNKVKNNDHKDIQTMLAKLSDIDNKIMALKEKDGLLYFIMQNVTDMLTLWDEDGSNEYKKRIKIAEKSCFFYSRLYDMSNDVKKTIDVISLGGTHDKPNQ